MIIIAVMAMMTGGATRPATATTMTAVAGAAMADGSATPVVMPKLPGVVGMSAAMIVMIMIAAVLPADVMRMMM